MKWGRVEERVEAEGEELGNPIGQLLCRCEQGHLELVAGRSALSSLAEAEDLAGEAEVGEQSQGGQALARLRRAQSAWGHGRPLFRGERLEELPEGLRRWLEQTCQVP